MCTVPAYIKMNVKSANISAVAGTRVALDCQSSGVPKPQISWFNNNKQINEDNSRMYIKVCITHSLTHSLTYIHI